MLFAFCLTSFGQMPPAKKSIITKKKSLPKAYYLSDWSLGISVKYSVENILPNLVYSKAFKFNYQSKFPYKIELFIERKLENNWIWVSGVNYRSASFENNHIFSIFFDKAISSLVGENYINQYDLTINNSFEQINFIATAEYFMFDDENDYQDKEELNFRISSVNTIKYLGIPLAIKKEFGFKKLKFSMKGGIEPAIIIKKKIDYERYHQSSYFAEGNRPNYKSNKVGSVEIPRVQLTSLEIVSQTNNVKILQINAFVNVGLAHTYQYHTFFLEAEYKRGLSAFSRKETYTSYLNNYSFKTGFAKRFKERKVIDMVRLKDSFKS
jgi:hypothetical protein